MERAENLDGSPRRCNGEHPGEPRENLTTLHCGNA